MTAAATQPEEPSEPEVVGSLSCDECFELLSNHRRRYTLHYLQQCGQPVTLGDLSEQIAAWENETTVEDISYNERKRVYTSLQQVHLPRMDDAGVIEFDDREGTVDIDSGAEDLDIYLEIVQGRDVPWSFFYFGLALLNVVVVGAFVLGIPPVAALPEIGLPVFVVTSFFVASLAHLYVTQTEMQLGTGEEPPSLSD